jgi:hypothetical protein
VGTGAIGPLNADFAATFSVLKQNFSASPTAGEIDGAYFVARNGGSNSDTTGFLVDVANYGQGFNAAMEGNTNAIVGATVTQTVDTQVGVVDTRSSHQYGYVATKTTGAGNGIAYYASNIDTGGGTGQWQHLIQFGGGGCTGFDMPISTGDVVTMLMSDCTGGSKLFGVTGNDYYIDNAAQTQRILQLDDAGDLTNSGSFATGATTVTTLGASGAITPSQTAGIVGTTTNNNANAGSVGEYISQSVPAGSEVPLTTITPKNVASITLSAGDWDVTGNIGFDPAGTTITQNFRGGISTTSATLPLAGDATLFYVAPPSNAGAGADMPTGTLRLSLATPTTVYLVAQSQFTTSTSAAYGYIGARRRR